MKQGLEHFHALVDALVQMPGVGRKSALRLGYEMVAGDQKRALRLCTAIEEAILSVRRCQQCLGLCEDELCSICSDESRHKERLCVVENPRDIWLIEESGAFDGIYFVFEQCQEETLERMRRLIRGGVTEVLFALTPGVASDSMMFYIEDQIASCGVSFYKMAQGVPTGVSLEHVDSLSILRALHAKTRL